MQFRTLLVLSLLFSCAGCAEPETDPVTYVPAVKVFTVDKLATGQSRRISGKLRAVDRSPLSFGVGGRVTELLVREGQQVATGQRLAQLDPEPLTLAVEELRGRLSAARARLVEAEGAFGRTKQLLSENIGSPMDLEAATAALGTATGEVTSAQRSLEKAELDLERTQLTAPFAGRIVQLSVDPFQEITAGQDCLTLQTDGLLEAEVLVPETLIREVDYGQRVQVEFPTVQGLSLGGTVSTIGAEAIAGNAFPVTVVLDETQEELIAGLTASVTFKFDAYLDGRSAFLVPISSIAIDAGLPSGEVLTDEADRPEGETVGRQRGGPAPMYVFDPTTQTVDLREVWVGGLRGNEVEVFKGLERGDQVVVAGLPFLRDGMSAKVWTPRN